ncbi:hypothetical protein JL722_13812 [Aureococcus anophagefferens]|nr:hypothetical protein JL722_13812 [Aureococcus anophagefferens]
MILADGSPALLDWGLAAELDVATRAFLARVVLLLNLRDKRAVREGLVDLECNAKRFTFNAAARDDDPDFVAAFMYQFFDTSAEGVDLDPKLFDRIFYLLQHDPTSFPTLTNCPKEVVLFVRTVSALRRCLRAAGGHRVAASERWAPFARRAPGPRARRRRRRRRARAPGPRRVPARRARPVRLVPAAQALAPATRRPNVALSRLADAVDAPRSLAGAALRLASADAVHDALAVVERLYRARRAALVLGLALGAGAWVLRAGGV